MKMKIISLNVNNFGGLVSKPLIQDYSYNGKPSWGEWNNAVISWREKILWEFNVDAIVNSVRDFDIIVMQEVDTNSDAFKSLIKRLDEYSIVFPNKTSQKDFCRGYKSITVMFIKLKNISTMKL